MKTLIVIPSRYASTRFPGKPLALLGGRSIVSRVWQAACTVERADAVVVATDDRRILDHVNSLSNHEAAMLTSTAHHSGTDRCGEVLDRLAAAGERFDVVVNLQGDEPFVRKEQIESLIDLFADPAVEIATLRCPIHTEEELLSPNNVKVVCDSRGRALYFSRLPIPYRRGVEAGHLLDGHIYHKHVGLYAFRSHVLQQICTLQPSRLEECEKLEQLRWIEAGYAIHVADTQTVGIGIDTPQDLAEAEEALRQRGDGGQPTQTPTAGEG